MLIYFYYLYCFLLHFCFLLYWDFNYDLGNKYQRTNIIFSNKYNKEIFDVANLILKENHFIIKVKYEH